MTKYQLNQIPDSFIPNYLGHNKASYFEEVVQSYTKRVASDKESLIRAAFQKAGFDVDDIDFVKNRVTSIRFRNDMFTHYYMDYDTDKAQRVISISEVEVFNMANEMNQKAGLSFKYY